MGAIYSDGQTIFRVWAPFARRVDLQLFRGRHRENLRLNREDRGYHSLATKVDAGGDYGYLLDRKKLLPDPASRYQPQGVRQVSRIVDPDAFEWTDDAWSGVPGEDLIIYEIHVGTFSREGTFEGVIPHLD